MSTPIHDPSPRHSEAASETARGVELAVLPVATADGIPVFRPSTVLHASRGRTLARTWGSVGEVAEFQRRQLQADGWQVAPLYEGLTNTTLVAVRCGRGACVQVRRCGEATTLSITTW